MRSVYSAVGFMTQPYSTVSDSCDSEIRMRDVKVCTVERSAETECNMNLFVINQVRPRVAHSLLAKDNHILAISYYRFVFEIQIEKEFGNLLHLLSRLIHFSECKTSVCSCYATQPQT